MVFQTVKVVSTPYTANVPNTRNLIDKIPLLGDLRRVELTVRWTMQITAAVTYATTIPAKTLVFAPLRYAKFMMSSGSEEFMFVRGRHIQSMHSLLNTEKWFADTVPTGITASADYRGSALLNKMHLDSKNEYLYFNFEIADISELVTAGTMVATNIEVTIGFEYYNKRSDFATDFGVETNKVDAFSVVTGGLREISGLTLGRVIIATFIDGFLSSTINLNKFKFTDNGVVLVESSYYEYITQSLDNIHGLMDVADFANQLWYVPEKPIHVDNTSKLEVDVSSTRNYDFIHLYLR